MGLKIGALLITPVQRIPRYKMLLEDLLQNTKPCHHDYPQLKEAAKQVSDIALHINEHVRQNENFMKMLEIQNSFDSSARKILTPGREFIKEGKLTKMSRKGGKSMERMFFLFSDLIIYGKPKLLDSGKHSFTCCCMLPLRHCTVEKVLGSVLRSDGGGMFKISCKDENLLLHCNDAQDALCWVESIENAIRKINLNRQTLRKPSSNKVPVRNKSLIKMKLRERKNDPKKKSNTVTAVKKMDSPVRSPLKVLAEVDVSNCLTPRRNSKISESEETDEPYSQESDSENEINLDDWEPCDNNNSIIGDNSNNDDDDDNTISDNDENNDDESVAGILIENPPYPKTLDFDYAPPNDHNVSAKRKYNSNDYDDIESPQFYNQRMKKSKGSVLSCSVGPLKRVTKVTSSIGEMMDNVRNHKSCNLM
ncbi:Rho guanyl-nucleotide exchange factor [Mactra antiquata]